MLCDGQASEKEEFLTSQHITQRLPKMSAPSTLKPLDTGWL